MRRTLLVTLLMMIAAMMMGCTDSIVPCTEDIDCEWDWGWGDSRAAHGDNDWGGYDLTCSGPHPLDYCLAMLEYLPPLDWLPFGIGDWIKLPDCEALYGELPPETGTCESNWGWW